MSTRLVCRLAVYEILFFWIDTEFDVKNQLRSILIFFVDIVCLLTFKNHGSFVTNASTVCCSSDLRLK